MLLKNLSFLLLFVAGEGSAQHQKPLTPPPPPAAWLGCQGPGWQHVRLPNGGYDCQKTDKHCSGTFKVVGGVKAWECCPPNTYYLFNKKFRQGGCCPPRSGFMVHAPTKKGGCCLLGNKYYFNTKINRGSCCPAGRIFSADEKTKTGACCPVDSPWNGKDCSGVQGTNVQCAPYQIFDSALSRCKDVCKHTEYYCLTDKKCKTCAEGTQFDMAKKHCASICKPNVEFWCHKSKKCMAKKPCHDGQKCCDICNIDQKWCNDKQACIDKCAKGQVSVMGRCIKSPVTSVAHCNAAGAQRTAIKCPGPACYLPKEEEMQMTFGPKGSWFFNIRTVVGARFWHGLPPALEALVSKDNGSGYINDLSISPDGEWMIIKSDGTNHWWKCSNIKKYPVLEKWMKESKFRLQTLRVTLGVNGAFFAYHENGYRWVGLSEPENEHLQSMLNNRHNFLPHHLSIGLADNYAITSKLGHHFRKTLPLYPTLDCILRQTPHGNVAYVALNPYAPDEHFVAFSDMTANWKVSGHLAAQITKFNGVIANTKSKIKPYNHGPAAGARMRIALTDKKPKIRMARVVKQPTDAQHDDHEYQQHFEMDHHDDVHLDHDDHSAGGHPAGDIHMEHHDVYDDEHGHHEEHHEVHHEEHHDPAGLHHEVHHAEEHHETHDMHGEESHDGAHLPPQASHTEEAGPEHAHPPIPEDHAAAETHGPGHDIPVGDVPHMRLEHESQHVDEHDQYVHEHADHGLEHPLDHPDDHKAHDESAYHEVDHGHDEHAHDMHDAHAHVEMHHDEHDAAHHEAEHHDDAAAHHEEHHDDMHHDTMDHHDVHHEDYHEQL